MANNENKLIYFNNETGLFRASKSAIKQDLKSAVTEAYGKDVLLDDNYPDGIWINHYADKFNDIFDLVEIFYNALDINNAEGVILDTIGNLRNEHRKKATNSTLYVNITVTTTCTFTANNFTLIDENNNYWILAQDITIVVDTEATPPETSATGIGLFKSSGTGVLQEPTQVTIASSEASLPILPENISLTINKFESGQNDESDIVFRNRMNEYTVFNSITLKENLNSQLFNLEYILDAKIYYNNSLINLTTKGNLNVPPGRMYVLIKVKDPVATFGNKNQSLDEADDNKNLLEVFDTIANYKGLGTLCWLPEENVPAGAIEYKSKSVDTSEEPEHPYLYDGISEFIVPQDKVVLGLEVKYIKTSYFDEDNTEANIKTLLASYINNKGIGEDLTVGDLINYLYLNTNEIYVASLSITGAVSGVLANPDAVLSISESVITVSEQQ